MEMSKVILERLPSVTDDELFGEGTQSLQEIEHSLTLGDKTAGENTDSLEHGNTASVEDGNTNEMNALPHFDIIMTSESLGSSDSNINVEAETETYMDKKPGMINRSISEASGKDMYSSKRHSYVYDGEDGFIAEATEQQLNVQVRKSNSLPDLILSSSSPITSPRPTSNFSGISSPDVIMADSQTLFQQKHVRENFEGKSIRNLSETGTGEMKSGKRKLVKRSVSFSDNIEVKEGPSAMQEVPDYPTETGTPNIKHSELPVNDHDAKGKQLVLYTRTSSETFRQNSGDSSTVYTSAPNTPKTPEGRRELYSKSSGYNTGSEESQDKGQSGRSNMSDEIFKWKLQADRGVVSKGDAEQNNIFSKHSNGINHEEGEAFDASPVNSSGSSHSTVIGSIPSITKNSSVSPHYIGSRDEKKRALRHSSSIDDDGFVDGPPSIKEKRSHFSFEDTQQLAEQLHQSQRSLGYQNFTSPQSLFTPTSGNIPYIVDESFNLGPSMLEKVDEEDREQHEKVIQKYCSPSPPAMPGSEGAVSARNTTSLPDAGKTPLTLPKTGTESLPLGGHSLLQSGPKSHDVRRFEEILQTCNADNFEVVLQRLIVYFAGSDSSTPSSSPCLPERCQQNCSPSLEACSLVTPAPRFTTTDLEKASRCTVGNCLDPSCRMKWEIDSLLASMATRGDSSLLNNYCMSLWQHSENCSDCKCPVTYCSLIQNWPLNEIIQQIHQLLRSPVLQVERMATKKYVKLHESVQDVVPRQYVTFTPLSVLGGFGSAVLAMETKTRSLAVLKEYPLFEGGHQGKVYGQLRNLAHTHLVPQLWLLEYADDVIQVFSLFMPGGSLKDLLCEVGKLSWPVTVGYMKQITDAVCHLQTLDIVYLYWKCENMYFPDTRRAVVKVGNFSLSCPLSHDTVDLGATKECLPYNICPPELLSEKSQIVKQSDVWGAGCLLAEMLTGLPVWHDMRHEDRDTVHKKIRQMFPKVDIPSRAQAKFLHNSCWQVNPERRNTMEEINKYFISA